jgi:DeoR/GlpR family transcriptional regulator of sugar metabolism
MSSKRRGFFIEEQENMILNLLHRSGHVTVEQITEQVGISPSTARIRLNVLHDRGLLVRTHGGAIERDEEEPHPDRSADISNLREKESIARLARNTVHDGDIIAIGAGTTTLLFARALHGLKGVTVITSSIFVVSELTGDAGFDVRICGGMVRTRTGSCFGPHAEKFFESITTSKCYYSFESVSVEREFTTLDVDTRTDAALIKSAKEHYALADHTKLSAGPYFERIGSFAETKALFMDSLADPAQVARLRAAGLHVELAEV